MAVNQAETYLDHPMFRKAMQKLDRLAEERSIPVILMMMGTGGSQREYAIEVAEEKE